MNTNRRHVLAGAAIGVMGLLSGCIFSSKPGFGEVNREISSAPGVTESDISGGPGGGLGTSINGTITLKVTADELHDAFEEAWGRGVAVIHQMFDPEQFIDVGSVMGVAPDGTKIAARELLGISEPESTTMSQYYEHYGLT